MALSFTDSRRFTLRMFLFGLLYRLFRESTAFLMLPVFQCPISRWKSIFPQLTIIVVWTCRAALGISISALPITGSSSLSAFNFTIVLFTKISDVFSANRRIGFYSLCVCARSTVWSCFDVNAIYLNGAGFL